MVPRLVYVKCYLSTTSPFSGVVRSSELLQVSTNTLAIANPLLSEPTLQKYLFGKDDLVMNGERYNDQYPVDGALDIESRAQRDEVKSEQHWVATEVIYAGRAESGLFLCESDPK